MRHLYFLNENKSTNNFYWWCYIIASALVLWFENVDTFIRHFDTTEYSVEIVSIFFSTKDFTVYYPSIPALVISSSSKCL